MSDYETFVDEATPRLLRLGLALTGSLATAEDLVQEALIVAFRRWARLDARGRYAYARRSLVNAHIDLARKSRASAQPSRPTEVGEHGGVTPEGVLLNRELDREIRAAVRSLPPHQQAVVTLKHFENLSTREIADALNIRESTVRSSLNRGHATLRIKLHGTRLQDDKERDVPYK
ncbi:sigma-70 family RNA polymerase sigma factor [Nocardioides agariphilus]|uniref:Sigma-70 family RNA polymerase sigma factor n=1 Tax=Nocardioides agariphilus TaxID=433664 RepID=A0A930VKY9_9ACTN|nr:sigma-70 family RNA polymerase sigma factor [Nocardioides agariphilus]MBF4766462.1 sigma-70 family RNA polymerase sigma factor [Nocardioides agariphilus]